MSIDDGWGGKPPDQPLGAGTEFDTVEVRATSIYGARTFTANDDGYLMGVVVKRIWTPGVNYAECWRVTGWDVPGVGISTRMPTKVNEQRLTGKMRSWGTPGTDQYREWPEIEYIPRGWSWTVDGVEGVSTEQPTPLYGNNGDNTHSLINCSCGWHGYLSGSLDYADSPNRISGVVEVFGTIVLGARGFRASMARIVALYLPPEESNALGKRYVEKDEPLKAGLGNVLGRVPAATIAKVAERYPDVPLYTDLDEMLTKHPTEEPSSRRESP